MEGNKLGINAIIPLDSNRRIRENLKNLLSEQPMTMQNFEQSISLTQDLQHK
jgi:hypothetical protein